MTHTATRKVFRGNGVVRDKTGKPRIDDIDNIPPGVMSMLTPQERRDVGLWDGFMIRDAQGIKRAELVRREADRLILTTLDPIVGGGDVFVDGIELRLSPRFDAPVGEELTVIFPKP